jgi:hypothetical protein
MVFILTEGGMPVQLFTEAERVRRNRFPEVIAYEDLVVMKWTRPCADRRP